MSSSNPAIASCIEHVSDAELVPPPLCDDPALHPEAIMFLMQGLTPVESESVVQVFVFLGS